MTEAIFIRVLSPESDAKAEVLHDSVAAIRAGAEAKETVFKVDLDSVGQVPGSPFAYWTTATIRSKFTEYECFEKGSRSVRLGLSTKNDSRFVRVFWEVPATSIGRNQKWATYANGGAFSPFYYSYPAVVNAGNGFAELKEYVLAKFPYLKGNAGWILHSENNYIQPCIGWPLRTSAFSPHFLPADCVFSARTYAAYIDRDVIAETVAVFSSSVVDYLLKLSLGRSGHPEFVTHVVRNLPWPSLNAENSTLSSLAQRAFAIKQALDSGEETSRIFGIPSLLQMVGDSLKQRAELYKQHVASKKQELEDIQRRINEFAFRLYRVDGDDRRAIEAAAGVTAGDSGDAHIETEDAIGASLSGSRLADILSSLRSEEHMSSEMKMEDEVMSDTIGETPKLVTDLLSYLVGCAFGRWDPRFGAGLLTVPPLPDPFASLPVYAPGMLTPAIPCDNCSFIPDPDGLLADDIDHPSEDLPSRAREVLCMLFPEQFEAIEAQACTLLGVRDLREYYRKPTEFWPSHLARYSKSRRKAPIYWLLQSARRSYALWLYYPKFDADLLFKALVNYVEPKLRLEDARLLEMRERRMEVGAAGGRARTLERQVDRQEELLSELRDFSDKLRRAADLRLTPDLNDGVLLNIAPLWELVPWKEAKKTWQELRAGKHSWSSIAQQLNR